MTELSAGSGSVVRIKKNGFLWWFAAVNLSVLAIVVFIPPAIFFPFIGFGGAFLSLFIAKWLAIKAHGIRLIKPDLASGAEQQLHQIVAELATAAELPKCPEVGVYESPDVNAFATGASRSSALVAFSTGLLEKLTPSEIRAVAAHEVAHIANRDMLGIVMIQGVVNSVVLAVTLPLVAIRGLASMSSETSSAVIDAVLWLTKVIVAVVLLFMGSLITKAYSRRREYRADALAAQLVGKQPMAAALRKIALDDTPIPKAQLAYAAFKIAARPAISEIFSTHPAIERRLERLEALDAPSFIESSLAATIAGLGAAQIEVFEVALVSEKRLPSALPEPAPATRSVADELLKLAELRDRGVLAEDEFDVQKRRLLDS